MTISTQRLRFLRGNTAAASAFTGLQGELIFDTTLYTLRLQDGVTPGGYTLATSAQLANVAANANYGNSNVGAYLTSYTGNLRAGNILSNNYLYANGVSILTGIQSNYGNSNVAAYLTVYTGNLSAGNIFSNNYLYANGVNILTGVQSNYGNANVAAYLVANPQPGTYSNTNVASYLTSVANVKVGFSAGFTNQGFSAVAIGPTAAANNQGSYAIAIGATTAQSNQGNNSVAIGTGAAAANQGTNAIAIGTSAGSAFQGNGAVAIGSGAGGSGGSDIATVAIGDSANVDGNYSIAIGRLARAMSASTIMLNATGSILNSFSTGFYVDPISSGTSGNVLYYNTSTKQITYGAAAETYGNANVASYLPTYTGNIAGNIVKNGQTWTFGTDGKLTLPGNVSFTRSQQIYTTGTAASDNYITISANIQNDINGFQVGESAAGALIYTSGNVRLITNTSDAENTWTFATDGNVTVPGSILAEFVTSPAPKITGFDIDTTRVMVNGNVTAANFIGNIQGPSTVFGNLSVTGNLIVSGNTITVSTNNFVVSDNIIFMANNNPANILDIGFAAHYTTDALRHTGFVKDVTDGTWKLFSNVPQEITTTVDFTNAIYDPIRTGNITAPYFVGNGASLTGISTYSNANVASYLPTYTGNISSGNLSVSNEINVLYNGNVGLRLDAINPAGIVEAATGKNLILAANAGTTYMSIGLDGTFSIPGNIVASSNLNLIANNQTWNFSSIGTGTGNLSYPDGTKYSGNTVTLANSSSYYWKFNEPAGPVSDTITLNFNSLTTTLSNWYFGTDNTANTWILDSSVKSIGFSDNPGFQIGGRLTFGTLANLGNASANDIELSSVNANAYVRASNSIWKFDVHNNLTVPGSIRNSDNSASIEFNTNNLRLNTTGGGGYIDIQAADIFILPDNGSVVLGSSPLNWQFNANGNLTLPANNSIIAYPNGVSILSGITGGSSNYGNANVATFLGSYGSNTIVTTGNISAGYFVGNGALLTGIVASGANYSNANVVSMLAANTAVFIGNVGNVSVASVNPLQANNTQLFIGNNAGIVSGNGATNSTQILHNMYISANGTPIVRNTQSGAGIISLDPSGFSVSAVTGAVTANTAQALTRWITANASSATFGLPIISTGSMTAAGFSLSSGSFVTSVASLNLFQTTATTINLGGAASAINMGTSTGNVIVAGSVLVGNSVGRNDGNLTIRANGIYNSVTSLTSNGGYGIATYTNIATTGGSGTGMIISMTGIASGYLASATVTNSGTGYRNGDTITIPAGNPVGSLGGSFVIQNYNPNVSNSTTLGTAAYLFGMDGNLTLPGSVSANGSITMSGGNISGVGNIVGTTTNTTITANTFVTSFLSNGAITTTSNVIVTGSNAVSMPNLPAFRVYGNTSAQFLGGTTLTNQVVDYNQGSYYNNSTGLFTAPVAGLYHCYATVRVGSNNGLNQASIQKNSSNTGANVIAFWETDTNAGTALHFAMTGYAKCVVGDTIRLQVISGNVQFDTNDSWGVTFIG